MSAVAKRYARAAVELAAETGDRHAIDAVAAGLAAVAAAFNASSDLREVMRDPAFKRHRLPVLDAVLEQLDVTDIARRVVRLLATSDRITVLDAVAQQAQSIADEKAGRMRAEVISVIDLTPDQRRRVAEALSSRMGCDVVVDLKIDSSLLGGLICRVGDLTLDSSIKRQLEIVRERLELGGDR